MVIMLQHMLPTHFPMWQPFTRLHLHLLWQKLLMNGQHREERTFSDRKYRLQKCSLKLVLLVQFTALWQQVL